MNYELAKQLKDAGFPLWADTKSEVFVEPTLSELIAACGEGFGSLVLDDAKTHWLAFSSKPIPDGPGDLKSDGRLGQTPEEAVASLWLALNQKNV